MADAANTMPLSPRRAHSRIARSVKLGRAIDPDQAWNVLIWTNNLIRQAETKATTSATATGVMAGVLLDLLRGKAKLAVPVIGSAVACAIFAIAATACAWAVLRPRLRRRDRPDSLLFFDHVVRSPRQPDQATYVRSLKELCAGPDLMAEHVAAQVWANSLVAHDKYKWADRGIAATLLTMSALAVTAVLVFIGLPY